jgi:hypothetical protein
LIVLKRIAAITVLVLALAGTAGTAAAQTGYPPGQNALTATVTFDANGKPLLTCTFTGFAAGATVTCTIYSLPAVFATGTADANGSGSATGPLPQGTPAGVHTITASGLGPDGQMRTVSTQITITAAQAAAVGGAAADPPLARTGSNSADLGRVGILAIALGALALLFARKRRTMLRA